MKNLLLLKGVYIGTHVLVHLTCAFLFDRFGGDESSVFEIK